MRGLWLQDEVSDLTVNNAPLRSVYTLVARVQLHHSNIDFRHTTVFHALRLLQTASTSLSVSSIDHIGVNFYKAARLDPPPTF